MHKIAVIGSKDSVLGFLALGLSVLFVETAEEAEVKLKELIKEEYAVIYITEDVAQKISPLIGQYKDQMLPAIILIPGTGSSLGIGMAEISKSVERAVGADILFQKDKSINEKSR